MSQLILSVSGAPTPALLRASDRRHRVHARWWTALPALPTQRFNRAYWRLWRQFADHTMNTWTDRTDGSIALGSRGFYVEGREDHLVPAFFENFVLCTSPAWLERLLTQAGVAFFGPITDLAWSYSFEERPPSGKKIADVVIHWRDGKGEAVLVIEAKRPGAVAAGEKDDPRRSYYLSFPAMSAITRRHQVLLVGDNDRLEGLPGLDGAASVLRWGELARLQADEVERQLGATDCRDRVLECLHAHHARLGIAPGGPAAAVSPTPERWLQIKSLDAPETVKAWLMGAEVHFATVLPDIRISPPMAWLVKEPTAADYRRCKRQSSSERKRPVWKLDWIPPGE